MTGYPSKPEVYIGAADLSPYALCLDYDLAPRFLELYLRPCPEVKKLAIGLKLFHDRAGRFNLTKTPVYISVPFGYERLLICYNCMAFLFDTQDYILSFSEYGEHFSGGFSLMKSRGLFPIGLQSIW